MQSNWPLNEIFISNAPGPEDTTEEGAEGKCEAKRHPLGQTWLLNS